MANTLVAAILLVAVLAAFADAVDDKTAAVASGQEVAAVGGVAPRRVVDGVLSMLGVPTAETEDADDVDDAGEVATKKVNPGERGIHKKKFYKYALWSTFYWWAWAFAVVAVKFKVALLVIWGHVSYFTVALIRMLLREVPSWIQLKRDPAPVYGPPPPAAYGPQPQYGYAGYSSAGSYAPSPYKRRAGSAGVAGAAGTAEAATAGGAGHDLAYGAHARRK